MNEHSNRTLLAHPVRIGLIGCGDISTAYLQGCAAFESLEIVSCADLDTQRAEACARQFGIARVQAPDQLIADDDVELVLNLTPPAAHASVSSAAIAAGKHVYSEKPLAHDLEAAAALLADAEAASVRIGCAPDTVLGGALQTSRKLIDDGWIGQPLAAAAFVPSHGYEHFHPRIDYYYAAGGGPVLDVGPYYITALVHLLGPIRRVSGSARRSSAERVVPTGGNTFRRVPVHIATHVAGTLDFDSGVVGSLMASWDVWSSGLPYVEVYGTEGSLRVPNPDNFDGIPYVLRPGSRELEDDPPRDSDSWHPVPLTHRGDVGRGIGLADMAAAIRADAPHRLDSTIAFHVLEALLAFEESSSTGTHISIESRCERPAPLPRSIVGSPVVFEPDGDPPRQRSKGGP